MGRGTLRIFLGAAPGAGTTYAMLTEGLRLTGEGADVVIGAALHRGRPETAALFAEMEAVSDAGPEGVQELDLHAVLSRAPETVLVDDLTQANGVDGRRRLRWEDVDDLLDAGINVMATLEIARLESLGDVVEAITGARSAETVPDAFVRGAGQIELVDVDPGLLLERVAAGKVVPAENVDAALAGYFRLGNLTALRELALLWLADRVEEGLSDYRARKGIEAVWNTRERIVVGLPGGPGGQLLVRRAFRMLAGNLGAELHAVHVRSSVSSRESPGELDAQRVLVSGLGGTYHSIGGDDPARALVDFARSIDATQIVVGVPGRKLRFRPSVGQRLLRLAGDVDVHLVGHGRKGAASPVRTGRSPLGRGRMMAGAAMALLLPFILQAGLSLWPHSHFATDMLVQLTGTIAVALVGGLWPAVAAAVLSSAVVNFSALHPIGTMGISDPENVLALLIFLAVAIAVSFVVGLSAKRSRAAAAAGAEAAALAELSRSTLAAHYTIGEFLDRIREHFQSNGAALYARDERPGKTRAWQLVASTGTVDEDLNGNENVEQLDPSHTLALAGRPLSQQERHLLTAFGAHLMALLQRDQLRASRRDILRLSEGNRMGTSILRAVSHDLRTPLAGIKLAVSSLRQDAVEFDPEDEAELLATIEDYADRLGLLVGNLLDMSRLTADSVTPLIRPVYWTDAVADALRGIPKEAVRVDLPDSLPPVDADPGMLERVIANVVENAVKYAGGSDIIITAVTGTGNTSANGKPAGQLRIIDHGRGVPATELISMFQPFQRLDDTPAGTGVGLGLAVAKGFTEVMDGHLDAEETPGGGLTIVITMPLSAGA